MNKLDKILIGLKYLRHRIDWAENSKQPHDFIQARQVINQIEETAKILKKEMEAK